MPKLTPFERCSQSPLAAVGGSCGRLEPTTDVQHVDSSARLALEAESQVVIFDTSGDLSIPGLCRWRSPPPFRSQPARPLSSRTPWSAGRWARDGRACRLRGHARKRRRRAGRRGDRRGLGRHDRRGGDPAPALRRPGLRRPALRRPMRALGLRLQRQPHLRGVLLSEELLRRALRGPSSRPFEPPSPASGFRRLFLEKLMTAFDVGQLQFFELRPISPRAMSSITSMATSSTRRTRRSNTRSAATHCCMGADAVFPVGQQHPRSPDPARRIPFASGRSRPTLPNPPRQSPIRSPAATRHDLKPRFQVENRNATSSVGKNKSPHRIGFDRSKN